MEHMVVTWLGVGLLLSPFALTLLGFLVLFYPNKLTFSECVFTSIPTSQSFATIFIFFFAGFSTGVVELLLLRLFVGGCLFLSFYLFLFAGGISKIEEALKRLADAKQKKIKFVTITALTILILFAFYQLFTFHTLTPITVPNSNADPFSLVEENLSGVSGYRTMGSSWSDLPMHLGIINSFRVGVNSKDYTPLEVKSILFSGTEMGIPFFADFHSFLLCRCGFDLRSSIVLPSTLLSSSLIILLFLFVSRFSTTGEENERVGIGMFWGFIGVLLVVFSGGSGILSFLASLWKAYRNEDNVWDEAWSLLKSVDYMQNYGHGGRELYWFSFIHHIIIPQRNPAYSYSLFVSVLLFLWRTLELSNHPPSEASKVAEWRNDIKTLFAFAGIIGGLSPLMSSPIYVALWLFGSLLFIFDIKKWANDVFYLFHWIGFFIPLFAVGYFQVTTVLIRTSSFQNWGSLEFNPIVVAFGDSLDTHSLTSILKKLIQLWFDGLGLFVFIFLYSFFNIYSDPLRVRFYTGGLGIFLFGNLFQINVWARDSIRLLYCWHFIASACICYCFQKTLSSSGASPKPPLASLAQLQRESVEPESSDLVYDVTSDEALQQQEENVFTNLKWAFVFLLIVILISSGVLPTLRETELNYDLYNADDIACGDWVAKNSGPSDVFLTSDSHLHPVFSLAGRSVALTFHGWLWAQGFDYKERNTKIEEAVLCRSVVTTMATLTEYKIKFIVLDEKFNSTLKARIDEIIQSEAKLNESEENESDSIQLVQDDDTTPLLPSKEILGCIEKKMTKVYENAKYQIYLLDATAEVNDPTATTPSDTPLQHDIIEKDNGGDGESEEDRIEEMIHGRGNSLLDHSVQSPSLNEGVIIV